MAVYRVISLCCTLFLSIPCNTQRGNYTIYLSVLESSNSTNLGSLLSLLSSKTLYSSTNTLLYNPSMFDSTLLFVTFYQYPQVNIVGVPFRVPCQLIWTPHTVDSTTRSTFSYPWLSCTYRRLAHTSAVRNQLYRSSLSFPYQLYV